MSLRIKKSTTIKSHILIYNLLVFLIIPIEGKTKEAVNLTGHNFSLSPYTSYLLDPENSLKLEEIPGSAIESEFKPNVEENISINPLPAANWFRFKLKLSKSGIVEQSHWIMELTRADLTEVDLFYPVLIESQPGKKLVMKYKRGGLLTLNHSGDMRINTFAFDLPTDFYDKGYFYLRITGRTPARLGIHLWPYSEFLNKTAKSFLFFGFILSVLITIALYNLIIFINIKETIYIYYIGFLLFLLLNELFLFGYIKVFFNVPIGYYHRLLITTSGLAYFTGFGFTRLFLNLRNRYSLFDKLMVLFMVLGILLAFLGITGFYKTAFFIDIPLGTLAPITALIAAFITYIRERYRPALFFSQAWVVFIAGIVIYNLTDFFLSQNFFTSYTMPIGSAIGAILFTRAIAWRMKLQKEEMSTALKESDFRYRTIFDSAGDAIILVRNNKIHKLNEKSRDMFASTTEIIGMEIFSLFPEKQSDGSDSRKRARKRINRAMDGIPQIFEFQLCRIDGTIFDSEISISRVEYSQEAYILAVIRDISERKANEAILKDARKLLEQQVAEQSNELENARTSLNEAMDNRNRAEQTMKDALSIISENEKKYRNLFREAPNGILLTDNRGIIMDLNSKDKELLGYEYRDIVGRNITEFMPEREKERFSEIFKYIENTDRFQLETEVLNTQGKTIPVLRTVSSLTDEEGKIMGCIVHTNDISDRKAAENDLKRSEEEKRLIIDNLYDIFYRTDQEGKILFISKSVIREGGYQPEELVGKDILDYFIDKMRFIQFRQRIAKDGYVDNYKIQFKMKNGELKWGSINARLISDKSGTPIYIEGTVRNIEKTVKAEQEQKKSKEMLRSILDASVYPIVITKSDDGTFLYSNFKAIELLRTGFTSTTGFLHSTSFYNDPKDKDRLLKILTKEGEIREKEVILKNSDGENFWARLTIVKMEFGGNDAHLTSFYDVTSMKNLQNELKKQASTDPLTAVFNRRYFIQKGEEKIKLLKRYSTPLAIFMMDIDHFKRINDTYGHHMGDVVLKQVARKAMQILRETDIFGRLGGEEFGALLIETPLDDAVNAAERLRKGLEKLAIKTKKFTIRFTVSIGVTSVNPDDTVKSALQRADTALYSAKNMGRNRVIKS